MSDYTDEQIAAIARRVLADRVAGRQVDPKRIEWAESVLEAERAKLAADPRFAQWVAAQ